MVGQGGAYVKHIQNETKCRVQIKGQGSGFKDAATGQEGEEPMYLHVAGPDARDVQRAKELCEDLVTNVREQWQRHRDNPPPQRGYGGHGGGRNPESYGSSGYGGYGGGGYGGYGGYGQGQAGSVQSPTAPAAPGTSGASGA